MYKSSARYCVTTSQGYIVLEKYTPTSTRGNVHRVHSGTLSDHLLQGDAVRLFLVVYAVHVLIQFTIYTAFTSAADIGYILLTVIQLRSGLTAIL